MIRRFKKGDKVIAIEDREHLKKGMVYIVLNEIDNSLLGHYLIEIKDHNGYKREYYEFRFNKYISKKNHLPVWF